MSHKVIDCLKDELKSIEKSENGDTRLFGATPLDYQVAFHMFHKDFQVYVFKNRIYNGSAAGINEYGVEWELLAKVLRTFGIHCGAGDFKHFDKKQLAYIIMMVLPHVNDWYDDGPENARIRFVLWMDMVNSLHLEGRNLWEWF